MPEDLRGCNNLNQLTHFCVYDWLVLTHQTSVLMDLSQVVNVCASCAFDPERWIVWNIWMAAYLFCHQSPKSFTWPRRFFTDLCDNCSRFTTNKAVLCEFYATTVPTECIKQKHLYRAIISAFAEDITLLFYICCTSGDSYVIIVPYLLQLIFAAIL